METPESGRWRSTYYLRCWQNFKRPRLSLRVKWTSIGCPWELKQLTALSWCLGCTLSPAGTKPLHENLPLVLRVWYLLYGQVYARKEKDILVQCFHFLLWWEGRSRGEKGGWGFTSRMSLQVVWEINLPHCQWRFPQDFVQNLSSCYSSSKPGISDVWGSLDSGSPWLCLGPVVEEARSCRPLRN